MKIKDALKETGKAHREGGSIVYLTLTCFGVPAYFRKEDEIAHTERPSLESLFSGNWQPYHEEKLIKPEMQGEVWETKAGFKVFVCRDDGADLVLKREDGYTFSMNNLPDGLKRLLPPEEDDSVERIEIEEVEFIPRRLLEGGTAYIPISKGGFAINNDIALNPPMKMILERSKI